MSGANVFIAGFPTTDKVPGPYGEIVYGAGGNSGATAVLKCLAVGQRSSAGNLVRDTEIRQVWSLSDIDAAAGAGSELATQGYDSLSVAPGAPLYLMAPAPAGGATQATAYLTIAGSSITAGGTINIRIGGVVIGTQVSTTDTPTTIASNIALNVSGAALGRLPVTATAASGVVTFTCVSGGARGMQHVLFLDLSQGPTLTGGTNPGVYWYTTWQASTVYALNAIVVPSTANGYYYKATANGTSSSSPPVFPTTIGTTVTDGSVTWTCWGQTATSSANAIGIYLGDATGTETFTNALATLANVAYERIALACNDATSLSATSGWTAQITNQAGVLQGILQHAVFATNGSLSAATSLSSTTVNSQRFQQVWELNSETHPARMAAAVAAIATVTEQNDPAAMYDSVAINTIVPQAMKADWPTHATLVSALNLGVTPMFTFGDGLARICRSITTHCLSGGNSDYSTLDTAQARCPDYVLGYLMGYWSGTFLPANPRVQPDPSPSDKAPPEGVAYPHAWSSAAQGVVQQMINGNIPGTCPPILIPNQNGAVVTSSYDTNAKRIMSAVPITVAPANHQIGISVRQLA